MPTFLRIGALRFFFYSGDRNEPPHVHVEEGSRYAKFWLEPVRLQASSGFSRVELGKIQSLVLENKEQLLRCWDEYFND
ncbi:MAG: DUF4160 domain-containing protein [Anaerolineae bacterium]|nr:DUF4160 domain-containing protein [Anaerolineae bacterium]